MHICIHITYCGHPPTSKFCSFFWHHTIALGVHAALFKTPGPRRPNAPHASRRHAPGEGATAAARLRILSDHGLVRCEAGEGVGHRHLSVILMRARPSAARGPACPCCAVSRFSHRATYVCVCVCVCVCACLCVCLCVHIDTNTHI